MDWKRRKQNCIDFAGYLALRVLVCVISSVTLETCDRVCRVVAWVLADWTKLRRDVTDENLQRVYGDLQPEHRSLLRRQMWHHLLLMVCEVAHAPRKIHRTNYFDYFYMPKKSTVLHYMMRHGPAVLVTGHFGNFEVAGHTIGMLGTPTTTIARPLDNPFVDEYLSEFRELGGQRMLPKDGSAVAVQELLTAGGTLALLADQHAGGKGVWVDFFGYPTSCHKALALFVLSSKAPMLVTYNRRLGRPLRYEMNITGVADPELMDSDNPPEYLQSVTALTEWYNDRLEDAIRLAPEQYWWLHRRWREVPPNIERRLAKRRQTNLASESSAAGVESRDSSETDAANQKSSRDRSDSRDGGETAAA